MLLKASKVSVFFSNSARFYLEVYGQNGVLLDLNEKIILISVKINSREIQKV